jgi:nitrate/nitrite transporter NarK
MAGNSRRWVILGLGVAAQAASCLFIYGLPYLIPELRQAYGLSLGEASLLITSPVVGVVLALVAWGAVADSRGERMVIAAGLVAAAAALGAAVAVRGPVWLGVLLAVAGIGGASVFAASGRLVLGWFGPKERGLAMGARQTAQPLGVMLAAAILPAVATAVAGPSASRAASASRSASAASRAASVAGHAASRATAVAGPSASRAASAASRSASAASRSADVAGHAAHSGAAANGIAAALAVCAALCLLAGLAVALFATDPPRAPRPASAAPDRSPYRAPVLWRIHAASTLLVVPQFVTTGFSLEYLVSQRGWALLAASRVIAVANFAGALTRIAAGKWSDLVNSRLRPMRQLAVAIAVLVGLVALGAALRSPFGAAALFAATALAVSTNGLAYTAVAEIAGMSWAGRALGVQNTAQNIAAAATPPVMAQLIQVAGYPASFGMTALFPVAAAVAIPASARAALPPQDLGRPQRDEPVAR